MVISPWILAKFLQVPKPVLKVLMTENSICLLLTSPLLSEVSKGLLVCRSILGDSSELTELMFDCFAWDLLLAPPVRLSMSHAANIGLMSFPVLLIAWYMFHLKLLCDSFVSLLGATLISHEA